MPHRADSFAKQRRYRHVMHPAERPQAEGERGEQAIDERQRKFVRMQRRHHRQRQQLSEQADDDEGKCCARDQPDDRADAGQHDHLRQIDRKHLAAGGAQRFVCRDHVAAAIDMALHRVGDPDAANQERGETDQGQKLREAVDGALKLRRGVGAAADFPAGLRQCASRIVDQRGRRALAAGIVRQLDPVVPAHQAAGLQQSGRMQRGLADEEARTEADAAGELVRLSLDRAVNLEGRVADRHAVADLQIKPRQKGRVGRRSERSIVFGEEIIDRQFRIERELAEHRVAGIDRLHLDQCEPAVAGARHTAQGRRDRYLAARAQECDFVRLGLALEQHESDVAAEQRATLARQSLAQARRDRANAADRHHAKRDAGDENVEAAQAAAQFAQCVAQRERRRAAAVDALGYDAHAAGLMQQCYGTSSRRRSGPSASAPRGRSALRACVVGHQHQGHAALVMLGEQEIDDLLSGDLVEISGGFVRDQNRRIGRQGARQGDALLFAAGQLRGIMMQPVGKTDRHQFLRGAARGIGIAGELQRHRDVLQRRHGRDQMK